jgi:uncharacterized membrane protein YkoI
MSLALSRISRRMLILLALILIAGMAESAMAKGKITRDQAVERVRSQMNGRVISAETRNWEGREVHNIRILSDDGRVKRIRIDSETGRQIEKRRR